MPKSTAKLKKKKKEEESLPPRWQTGCLWIGAVALALVAASAMTDAGLALLAISFIVWLVVSQTQKMRQRKKVEELIAAHVRALHRKRLQKVRSDDYGNVFVNEWLKEVGYFRDNVLLPNIKKQVHTEYTLEVVAPLIDAAIDKYAAENAEAPKGPHRFSAPRDLEAFCVEILCRLGWQASTTSASGDQGVDVVARKGTTTLVIQCKLYSSAVGNKAVQEIVAGRAHKGADVAIVVSNATYSRAAQELARSANVQLLHYTELADAAARLSPDARQ